jgi:2-C-methyl-D-erythritol 4-phosphate cytidylyltransferase
MNFAIVAAAGEGTRFEGTVAKQLYPLKRKPLLFWSLNALESEGEIDQIIIVHPPGDDDSAYRSLVTKGALKKIRLVSGGKTRFQSVWNGFKSISEGSEHDIVLIHDAARPLPSSALIKSVLRKTVDRGSAVPVLPIQETVKEIEGDAILKTLPRERLFVSQTPQGFQYGILKKAYEAAREQEGRNFTDEAMMVERAGFVVAIVPGEKGNIKITERGDLEMAEYYLRKGQ